MPVTHERSLGTLIRVRPVCQGGFWRSHAGKRFRRSAVAANANPQLSRSAVRALWTHRERSGMPVLDRVRSRVHKSLPASPDYPRFLPVGDAALTVEFGDTISPELNAQVVALDLALASAELDGIIEAAPSYRSLLICYDPLEISFRRLVAELRQLLAGGV